MWHSNRFIEMTFNLCYAHFTCMYIRMQRVYFILTLHNCIIKWQNKTKQSCQLVSIGGDKCCPFCLLFDFEIKTFESKCHFHADQSFIHSCYRINIICIENDLFNLVFVGGDWWIIERKKCYDLNSIEMMQWNYR